MKFLKILKKRPALSNACCSALEEGRRRRGRPGTRPARVCVCVSNRSIATVRFSEMSSPLKTHCAEKEIGASAAPRRHYLGN